MCKNPLDFLVFLNLTDIFLNQNFQLLTLSQKKKIVSRKHKQFEHWTERRQNLVFTCKETFVILNTLKKASHTFFFILTFLKMACTLQVLANMAPKAVVYPTIRIHVRT